MIGVLPAAAVHPIDAAVEWPNDFQTNCAREHYSRLGRA